MDNAQIIAKIDEAVTPLLALKAALQSATATPAEPPVADPSPAPTPTPTPAPTTQLAATLMGRVGDYTSGAKAIADGVQDVWIVLTGCPAAITRVTIRDGKGEGAVWTHDANNSWIVVVRPATSGGVADLFFTFYKDYASYKVELTFADGTTASLVTGTTAAGPAPAPAVIVYEPPPTPRVVPAGQSRTGAIPYTDQYCSAIMDGFVVCNVIMLESDSTTQTGGPWDENWNDGEKATIHAQIRQAAAWWEEAFRRAIPNAKHPLKLWVDPKYIINPVTISYEPITTKFSDRALWVRQALGQIGHGGSDYLGNLRKFNHAQRVKYGADWSFTMFVIDSENDSDGKFADGFACWGSFNGPECYLTSDAGSWGTERFWRNAVHEIGHIFGPRDSYAGSGSTYTQLMGYLKVQNTNAVDGRPAGAPPQVPDIMAGASVQDPSLEAYTPCLQTRQGLGWVDTDGDGKLDARG